MIQTKNTFRRFLSLIIVFVFMLPALGQRGDFDSVDFTLADQLAQEHKGDDLYALPVLVHKLTAPLQTDVERFRAIYYWVTHNVQGDFHLNAENDMMHKKFKTDSLGLAQWNQGFKKEVFNILLNQKRTLCSGYTYLIQKMASLAGIQCEIIDGFGLINKQKLEDLDLPNHSWNAVKLNGKWYLCDATWAAGYTDLNTYLFEFDYDDSYFLMAPSDFAKTHRPEDLRWLLTASVTAE